MSQEAIEKTSGILPEAWYDLIARLVPGAFASIVTLKSLTVPKGLLEGLLLGLIVFYIVGFFLEVFAEMIIGRFWPRKNTQRNQYSNKTPIVDSIEFWNIRHKLRPSQWQAVSKMSAESDMFKSFAVYFILQTMLFVFQILYTSNPGVLGHIKATHYLSMVRILPLEISLIMGAICIWYMRKLYKGAQNRLDSYIEINKHKLASPSAKSE
jgi:hypothetical protein